MGKVRRFKGKTPAPPTRLSVRIERASSSLFEQKHFNSLINDALITVLGEGHPSVHIAGDFDPSTGKGSLVVEKRQDLHLVWAALSVLGTEARSRGRVAIHLSQLTEVTRSL